jgi:RimJ/RimL family protein N-acetyltransferase
VLRGGSVDLRPMEPEDAWLLYRWFNDQRVLDDMGIEHTYFCVSMDEERQTVDRMLQDLDAFHCIIQIHESGEAVGMISLARIDERNSGAELRIVIGEVQEWDKGYGHDAVRAMADYGFRVRNLHRIHLRVAAYNARAIACYKSAGFRLEGTMRQDHFHRGEWRDALLMSLLRGELKGD